MNPCAGGGVEPVKVQVLLLDSVLDARLAQVLEDCGEEVFGRLGDLPFGTRGFKCAMRREAFDRERTRDPHLPAVLLRLVVERLLFGVACNHSLDFLLAHAAPANDGGWTRGSDPSPSREA